MTLVVPDDSIGLPSGATAGTTHGSCSSGPGSRLPASRWRSPDSSASMSVDGPRRSKPTNRGCRKASPSTSRRETWRWSAC